MRRAGRPRGATGAATTPPEVDRRELKSYCITYRETASWDEMLVREFGGGEGDLSRHAFVAKPVGGLSS